MYYFLFLLIIWFVMKLIRISIIFFILYVIMLKKYIQLKKIYGSHLNISIIF